MIKHAFLRAATTVLCASLILYGCSGRFGENNSLPQSGTSPAQVAPSLGDLSEHGVAHSQTETEEDKGLSSDSDEAARTTVKLTVPEGYTLARIGMTLEEIGVCTTDEFIEAAQTGDYSIYPLIEVIGEKPNRCYKLEGYLYPDTYEIYSDEAPVNIIHRMLTNFEKKITPEIRQMAVNSAYTFDEIVTVASIVEKESFGHDIMPHVSSVLHNRLDIGMQLQCDVTVSYVTGAIHPFITGDKDRFNEYYNTYKCRGIPAGAICNPSLDAIMSVLEPAEADYLFFVTDEDKKYYFAETWDEHVENVGIAMG